MTDPNKTLIAALLHRSGSTENLADRHRRRLARTDPRAAPAARSVPGDAGAIRHRLRGRLPADPDRRRTGVLRSKPRGRTALLDAVGRFISEIGQQLSALPEDQRPGHVICLIMTDGMENASHEWRWDAIQKLTKQQQDEWNWKFIFIGANMDAIKMGGRMGFAYGDSITYEDSSYASTTGVMRSARKMVRRTREGEDAAFSEEDRRAAMGEPRKSTK